MRTCAGCGRQAPQGELQPFHAEGGKLVPGRGPGRGSYTCHRLQCFERAASRSAFHRILRTKLSIDPDLARLYTGS
jgi:predicted RNA-binding protein YlxR (DUF448 family)